MKNILTSTQRPREEISALWEEIAGLKGSTLRRKDRRFIMMKFDNGNPEMKAGFPLSHALYGVEATTAHPVEGPALIFLADKRC